MVRAPAILIFFGHLVLADPLKQPCQYPQRTLASPFPLAWNVDLKSLDSFFEKIAAVSQEDSENVWPTLSSMSGKGWTPVDPPVDRADVLCWLVWNINSTHKVYVHCETSENKVRTFPIRNFRKFSIAEDTYVIVTECRSDEANIVGLVCQRHPPIDDYSVTFKFEEGEVKETAEVESIRPRLAECQKVAESVMKDCRNGSVTVSVTPIAVDDEDTNLATTSDLRIFLEIESAGNVFQMTVFHRGSNEQLAAIRWNIYLTGSGIYFPTEDRKQPSRTRNFSKKSLIKAKGRKHAKRLRKKNRNRSVVANQKHKL